ncbi:hypothetical protein AB0L33_30140 [Streptomyces sp. NPDC052299]|uniref:hypothetical protein n=1 Tax=Streptomyces sp. NPDC052299 TaxID=3155054 RepID=UPI00341D2B71
MAHVFPEGLLQAQIDWYATYGRMAEAPAEQTAPLRRRLLRLSTRITRDPHWTQVADGPVARMELKERAWGAADTHRRTS